MPEKLVGTGPTGAESDPLVHAFVVAFDDEGSIWATFSRVEVGRSIPGGHSRWPMQTKLRSAVVLLAPRSVISISALGPARAGTNLGLGLNLSPLLSSPSNEAATISLCPSKGLDR